MKHILFFVAALSFLHSFGQQRPPKSLRHFMQVTPSAHNAIPYGDNPKAAHYVQSGDAKIYYEVYGKGKPLVVLHGGVFGSTYEMHQFIDSLKKLTRSSLFPLADTASRKWVPDCRLTNKRQKT